MSMSDVISFLSSPAHQRIALTGHQRPDADSLGASVGLSLILRGLGRVANPVNLLPPPPGLDFILDSCPIHQASPEEDWTKDYDALLVLDCGEWERLDPVNRQAKNRLPVANLDHHASSLTGIGEVAWIEPQASSIGEMAVQLAAAAGWALSRDAAQALWTSIVADTGRFSYDNTRPATLKAAQACLEAGADPVLTAHYLFQSTPRYARDLQARLLTRAEFHHQGRLALSWLTPADFQAAGCGSEGTQNLINTLQDTAGVEVSLLVSEPPEKPPGRGNSVKASLRTLEPHDALRVVKRFGGGGHHRAAGCTLSQPVEAAVRLLQKAVSEEFFPPPHQ
ncbi:MAG: DHH family phosphoesterase [Planctomycetota bacterium]|jgi:phosphoesterase RecJ-like protein|nr:DHH family phosphoesterase [Planctomycetota bacterium]